MVRAATKVFVRTRPTDKLDENIQIAQDKKTILVTPQRRTAKPGANVAPADVHSFSFDGVLHNVSQEEVYEAACSEFVLAGLQGVNGTLLAYGQTGAGKTHSMIGGSDYRTRGIIPRALTQVFCYISERPDLAFEVRVSFLELHNESFSDLLSPSAQQEQLTVCDEPNGNVVVRGLTHRLCLTEQDALAALFSGVPRRHVAQHALNQTSSRSHALFTVHLSARSRVESHGRAVAAKLNFADLAGSERVGRSGADKLALREAQHINRSLSYLEQVVVALGSPGRDHVPFRSSKLTAVLRDALGGNTRTVLLANVWPEAGFVEETTSTLRFAARMARVTCDYVVNVAIDPDHQLRALQREVAELKAELALQAGRSAGAEGESSVSAVDATAQAVAYVQGPGGDIDLKSLRHARDICHALRTLVLAARDMASSAPSAARGGADAARGGGGGEWGADDVAAIFAKGGARNGGGVGALSQASGISVGVAQTAARTLPLTPKRPAGAGGVDGADGAAGGLPAIAFPAFHTTGGGGAAANAGPAAPPMPMGGTGGYGYGGAGGGYGGAGLPGAAQPLNMMGGMGGGMGGMGGAVTPPGAAATHEAWARGPGRVAMEHLRATQRLHNAAKARERAAAIAVNEAAATLEVVKAELDDSSIRGALLEAATGNEDPAASVRRQRLVRTLHDARISYRDHEDARVAAGAEKAHLASALGELKRQLAAQYASWKAAQFPNGGGGGSGTFGAIGMGGGGGMGMGMDGEGDVVRVAVDVDAHARAFQNAVKQSESPLACIAPFSHSCPSAHSSPLLRPALPLPTAEGPGQTSPRRAGAWR